MKEARVDKKAYDATFMYEKQTLVKLFHTIRVKVSEAFFPCYQGVWQAFLHKLKHKKNVFWNFVFHLKH